MAESVFEQALSEIGCRVEKEKRLSRYTSFQIGGEADYIVKPKSANEIVSIVKNAIKHNIDYFFMGGGSNILVSDNGYRGVVILTADLCKIELLDNNCILCESGVPISMLCRFALAKGLSGLEFAYGIPGTVGGGIYMNAGAYGGECKDVLVSCSYIDNTSIVRTVERRELDMSYRHSCFTGKDQLILSGVFALKGEEEAIIRNRMSDYMEKRRTKQPLEFPSCGSTFKRPIGGFASALIDECGLKGYSIGGAQVSKKHAGFVINKGGATCSDVLELISYIQAVVFREKGIHLECEVEMLGT